MSVRNAGEYIKWLRCKEGLTQEQLAEGICSTVALSQIENSKTRVRAKHFDALCRKMGSNETKYPKFVSENDFILYYKMKQVRKYLSQGNYYDAVQQMCSCTFQEKESKQTRAEFLFLCSLFDFIFEDIKKGMVSLKWCSRELGLPDDSIRGYKSLLEYEVGILWALNKKDVNRIFNLLEEMSYLPFSDKEIEYLRMLGYACLAVIDCEDSNIYAAKKCAMESILHAFPSGYTLFVCDLFRLLFQNTNILENIENFHRLFLRKTHVTAQDVVSLNTMASVIRHQKGKSDLSFVMKDVLRLVRTKANLSVEDMCYGICSKNAYLKYETGRALPPVDVLRLLMERTGNLWEIYAMWM